MTVRVQRREIPAELMAGDYANDPTFRSRMQDWMNTLWADKDVLIGQLRTAPHSTA